MLITYPENSGQIIKELVKKYGLSDLVKNDIKKLAQVKDRQTVEGILKNLPGAKLAEIVIRRAEGLLNQDDLPSAIREKLSIPAETGKKIANELEEKIISFIISGDKKDSASTSEQIIKTKKTIKNFQKSGPDSYRETIE